METKEIADRLCGLGSAPHREEGRFDAGREPELRIWQEENAHLTWVVESEPWRAGLEAAVIAAMKPPLNLADNVEHPFRQILSGARARFRAAAA